MAGESKEIVIAFVAGSNLGELIQNTESIIEKYKIPTDINDGLTILPESFKLYQNYPNPFNPSTTIEFKVDKQSFVNLSVFNLLGQKIAELVNDSVEQGIYKIRFNGSRFASGVYIYRLITDKISIEKKMQLLK
jgi:hypothetical protein